MSNGDGGDDDDDVPYEYPTTYPPKFPVGSYLSYVKRVAENSPVSSLVCRGVGGSFAVLERKRVVAEMYMWLCARSRYCRLYFGHA